MLKIESFFERQFGCKANLRTEKIHNI